MSAHADEFGDTLAHSKLCVTLLDCSKSSLSAEKQREFASAWRDFGVAAREYQDQWARETAKDPLLQRALDGYHRAEYVDMIYSDRREKLRDRFGLGKFNELEAKYQPSVAERGASWLDLQDTKLLKLYAWYLKELTADGRDLWPGLDSRVFASATESKRIEIIKSHFQTVRADKSREAQAMEREIDSIGCVENPG